MEMASYILQIYYCPKCHAVFQVQTVSVYYPPCVHCGHSPVIYRGKQTIVTK
jgi:Zn finger protein HypA/HybF involved in hydrogenase expression